MYIYLDGDDLDEALKVELDQILEEQYGSEESRYTRRTWRRHI